MFLGTCLCVVYWYRGKDKPPPSLPSHSIVHLWGVSVGFLSAFLTVLFHVLPRGTSRNVLLARGGFALAEQLHGPSPRAGSQHPARVLIVQAPRLALLLATAWPILFRVACLRGSFFFPSSSLYSTLAVSSELKSVRL